MEVLFPGGKEKALTFSYDDGQVYDRRMIGIMNKYGVRGTFHLNSGEIGTPGYITAEEIRELYRGMEVAGHTKTHPYLMQRPPSLAAQEIWEDRKMLESFSGEIVRGFSYPFGETGGQIPDTLRSQGIEYARTVRSTKAFGWPADFMEWDPTCHHNEATDEMIRHFLYPEDYEKNLLFYIWGHSFEFEREKTWDRLEEICRMLSGKDNVWYATNIEIKEYLTAVRRLAVSADGCLVYNPSAVPVCMKTTERIVQVRPGETVCLQ